MNRIILIGNGFDLAHGLKTSYKDFINDFWNQKCEKLPENIIMSIPPGNFRRIPQPQYDDEDITVQFQENYYISSLEWKSYIQRISAQGIVGFERFNAAIQSERIKYKNIFLKQITENLSLKNWVDIEYEYYLAMIECLDDKREGSIKQLNDEFSRIENALKEYLKTQTVSKKDYSEEIMTKICYPLRRDGVFDDSKEKWEKLLILDFNYTNTTSFYYQRYMPQTNIHIHGELENPENPIIFGYGDEMDKNRQLIEDKNDKGYLDKNKSINYLQARSYKELLAFIDADDYEIFIMGHSCGISDRTLLNNLFEHKHCKLIKPFYFEKGGKDNYDDIVMNIYRNFKDKNLCRARVVNRRDCEPLPQLVKP